ncbi:ABC transporter permease [Pseudogracilibacillus sp. SO30301A]|uniref:ABC transporter permease n=1 Tax=Pseudogracilibacillus sp. SO30301A TaxID=3098291 RepID=UPI00300E109E
MIWEIMKKQGIIFIRNKQQLFLLLLLPIILITILSASLSGFISGDTVEIEAQVALIEHTDEAEQIEKFVQEVKSRELSEDVETSLIETAQNLPFVSLLKQEAFEQVSNMIEVVEVAPEEKAQILADDTYAAVIEIPENYTYHTLISLLLEEGIPVSINVYENEAKELGAAAVKSVVESFQEQLTMSVFALTNQIDPTVLEVSAEQSLGTIEPIGQSEPVTSKEYYTIGMAVMNVLYLATTIGSFAFLEKQSHVFNRVILSNVSRWTYFTGVFASGTIFACIQLLIIFGFSWIIYGVTWPIPSFLVVTIFLSMAVGGLSTLLTAISYRMNSESVINFFSTILIAFLALLGGSFFPIGEISNVIQWIGDFTPNGASMSAYLSLLRGEQFIDILPHLSYLVIFTVVLLLVAVLSFPKRGQI